jgi:N-acetylglucosamine-6-sulfatase
VPPGWNDWYALFETQGYFNYRMNHNGRVVQYGSTASDYQTDVLANLATDYIRRTAGDPGPYDVSGANRAACAVPAGRAP